MGGTLPFQGAKDHLLTELHRTAERDPAKAVFADGKGGVVFRVPDYPVVPAPVVPPGAEKGERGKNGDTGATGPAGAAATIEVGSVTTGAPGSPAEVTNSGTSSAAVLDFAIPAGADGSDGTDGLDGADGIDGNDGIPTALAAIGSTPNANGMTLSGSTLKLEPADASFGGIITTGAQSFSGVKNFLAVTKHIIGNATTPSMCEDTDTNTGIAWLGSDVLIAATAGVERLRFDAAGNLLIGGTLALAGIASPPHLSFGKSWDTGSTRSDLKIYLLDDGGAARYGFGIGALGDVTYHSNVYHDFYIADVRLGRVSSSGLGMGTGTGTISARIHSLATTEQLRLGYDTSNYVTFTVSSTGALTLNGVGSGARFSFADGITLPAGTATAGTSPLLFTSGTNLTTAVAGAMEYNGADLFFTKSGTTRSTVLCASAATTEIVVSDTTLTVTFAGTTYKLLCRA